MRENSKTKILRFYRMIKEKPKKVWVAKDFTVGTKGAREILTLLVKLDILEIVPAVYDTGPHYTTRRDVKGYRLKK